MKKRAFFLTYLTLVALGVSLLGSLVHAATPFSLVTSDASYTDACKEAGTTCEYCCLTDKVLCTKDISICDPVTDRKVNLLYQALIVIAGAVIGFPLLIRILHVCLSFKFCKSYYKETNGVSCCEMFIRITCCCCCNFNKPKRKNKDGGKGRCCC